ncbi:MAG: hypothetical protein PVF51_03760 [Nitrospirota bacterium]|jgi:hypothetical protein
MTTRTLIITVPASARTDTLWITSFYKRGFLMDLQNVRRIVVGALVFAAVMVPSAPVDAQSLVILALVGGDPSGDYELCAWNPSAAEQDTTFVFQRNRSDLDTGSETVVVGLAPDETKCQIFTPPGAGVLSLRVPPPPASEAPDVPPDDPSARSVPTVYAQVWLVEDGVRIAPVSATVLCPTPSGVCPDLYRTVGNDPG